jgi:hypothetical protein
MSNRSSERRRRAVTVATCCVTLVLAANGCSVYDPRLVDSPGGGSIGIGDLPSPPAIDTSSPGDDQTLVFAMRDIVLNQNGPPDPLAWRSIGLDLDRLDTQTDDPERECIPFSGTPPLDGDDGIDNVLGQFLWGIIATELGTLSCEIALSHSAGRGTILLRVEHWNGASDDAQVTVSIAPAIDGTSFDGDASTLSFSGFDLQDGASPAPEPAWDGEDLFFLNPRAFFGNGDPRLRDVNAYITDDTIVVTLATNASFELLTDLRSVPIVLSQGYLVARMDEARANIERGILAGRYPLAELSNVGNSIGICSDSQDDFAAIYETLGDVLVTPRAADVPPNPDANCTALSMGVAFEGTAAIWQGQAPEPQPAAVYCDEEPAPPAECG